MFKLFSILEEVESPYNGKIQVVKTLEGTRILVGGISQSGWLVRNIWDRALKKIRDTFPAVQDILILGLGGGSLAELIQKYWPQAKVIGVDIDPLIVNLGKKYLNLAKVKNLEFIEEDAGKWVAKQKKKFDLVLVDIYKGEKIPKQFKEEKFIVQVGKLLKPKGVSAFNHLYSYNDKKDAHLLGEKLRKFFPAIVSICPEANIIFVCFKE